MSRHSMVLGAVAVLATASPVPPSLEAQDATLAIRDSLGAQVFWTARAAPRRWDGADPRVVRALVWMPTITRGVEWAELSLQGSGEARFTRVVVVRIDPRTVRFSLDLRTNGGDAAWNLDHAPSDAVVALNAGMFTGALPWGWLMQSGSERLAPARGPLSSAFFVRHDGAVEWIDGDVLQVQRARRDIAVAFQSYPTLLIDDGEVPAVLHTDAAASRAARPPREADVDRDHRDARLALGMDREGKVLIALTRFDGLGGLLDRLPFGFTVPEMSALMGALGARQAMLLDGGISAQLLIRTPKGVERLSGSRRVPLALIVRGVERGGD